MQRNGEKMKENNCILILTGGRIDTDFAAAYLRDKKFDRIIAADSGLASCRRLHLTPSDILGDFDSLRDEGLLAYYREQGVPVREFPARKDFTDTELAVEYAIDLSPEKVTLLGATGTRYDHALANIGMLEKLTTLGISGKIVDKNNEIEMLCGKNEKMYRKIPERKFFSLVAWGGDVTGIDLIGFSYPLNDATLRPSQSLGISNELADETGILRMKTGKLLVIRSAD